MLEPVFLDMKPTNHENGNALLDGRTNVTNHITNSIDVFKIDNRIYEYDVEQLNHVLDVTACPR